MAKGFHLGCFIILTAISGFNVLIYFPLSFASYWAKKCKFYTLVMKQNLLNVQMLSYQVFWPDLNNYPMK